MKKVSFFKVLLVFVFSYLCFSFALFEPVLNAFSDCDVLYMLRGNIYFVVRNGSVYMRNGLYIPNATVTVKMCGKVDSRYRILVEIRGPLYYNSDYLNCTGSSPRIYCNVALKLINVRLLNYSYTLALVYDVDPSNNYAWLNGSFIGFFPFYVVPDISYGNATKYKFVYLGKELEIDTVQGKPVPDVMPVEYGGRTVRLKSVRYYNDFIELNILHHYPVLVDGALPIGGDRYITVYLSPAGEMLERLIAVNDYPESVSYIDYARLGIIITVFAAIAIGIFMLVRRIIKKR
ncbi:MAG: hypothetical protein QW370_04970 [Ignisphaera sp.]